MANDDKTNPATQGDQLIIGTDNSNMLTGGLGNDIILCDDGNDMLNGGCGDDGLNGGDGSYSADAQRSLKTHEAALCRMAG